MQTGLPYLAVGVLSVLLSSFVAADVPVAGNLTMSNSTDASNGNILKNNVPFIHNYGTNNTFIGSNAGNFTMTGDGANTATGAAALSINTTGSYNTANGFAALLVNTTGSYNTASGYAALVSNTTGNSNTATGISALFNNTTGNANVATGYEALFSNTTGNGNTASGVFALGSNTTGSGNAASGVYALFNNTTGSSNTAVGYGADVNASDLTNATALGANAVVNASNKIRLGDTNVTLVEAQGDFHASGLGNGIILKSPDGLTCARLSIDNSGQLVTTPLACP